MTEEKKAQSFADIWSIKDEIIEKNKNVKQDIHGIPDEDSVSNNVNGFIINKVGNIVAKFGFYVETEGKKRIDLRISPDGFLAAIYNRPTNIILGYGHPLGFSGLVDPKQSNILHLGPDQSNGDQIIISIEKDEKLENQGIVCIIRDIDVMLDLLPEDIIEDFNQSLIDAENQIDDLNEIETSYNAYIKHIYNILGEQFNTKDNVVVNHEEEIENE